MQPMALGVEEGEEGTVGCGAKAAEGWAVPEVEG